MWRAMVLWVATGCGGSPEPERRCALDLPSTQADWDEVVVASTGGVRDEALLAGWHERFAVAGPRMASDLVLRSDRTFEWTLDVRSLTGAPPATEPNRVTGTWRQDGTTLALSLPGGSAPHLCDVRGDAVMCPALDGLVVHMTCDGST